MKDFKPFSYIQNNILRNISTHSPKDVANTYLDNRETKSHSYS